MTTTYYGPCQISGGPCDTQPTILYELPPGCGAGSRALCLEHARITQGVPMDRALMLAAPALLAALVDALKGIIEDAETLDVERRPAKIMRDLMAIASDARAAIARATQEPK